MDSGGKQAPHTHAGPRFDPAAVGFPLSGPAFPGTEHLTADTFKVVVASWRRLNPVSTPTSDFAVDVTSYAPKLPFVKRVQLVDAQVPNTQRLIEDVWNRLYYSQAFVTTPCQRQLDMEVACAPLGVARVPVSVVLPLPVDPVLTATLVPDRPGVVRITLQHRAPYPIVAVAKVWNTVAGGAGSLVLAGVPGLPTPLAGGFVLTGANVADADAGPNTFDVLSYPLAQALAAVDPGGDPPCLSLVAAPLPSDTDLATALTWAGTAALQACSSLQGALGLAGPWRFQVAYCSGPQEDRFRVDFAGPRHAPSNRHCMSLRIVPGALATYLGLDGVPLQSGAPAAPAPSTRAQAPGGYARIPSTNYGTAADLATAVAAAMSTYTWPPFALTVTLPSAVPPVGTVVPMAGGHGTLADLAAVLQAALAAAVPSAAIAVEDDASGLTFTSLAEPSPYAFALGFPTGPVPARLGYVPGLTTPFATMHVPSGTGVHIALWADCAVRPSGDVTATVSPAGEMVLTSVPFAPFQAIVSPYAGCGSGGGEAPPVTWLLSQPPGSTFMMGLQAGAIVSVVSAAGPGFQQVPGVIVRVEPLGLVFQQLDATVGLVPAAAEDMNLVIPQRPAPLVLYMQTASALVGRPHPVPAVVFGFQPDTYAPGKAVLTSPGTVRTRCDPFVLLCLSFTATDMAAMTGDVYYPLEVPSGGTQLVFAQVLRCNADFRSDYDRVFTHSFPGAGIHLGYIRVRLLNADGTPYITHGHPVTVCLRMDVVGDGISMGGPAHMTLLPDCRRQ